MKKKKMITIFSLILVGIICIGVGIFLIINNSPKNDNVIVNTPILKELPKPEITGGSRGELGIDKNINETNIDEYLNREDSVYRDMRMLEDPAQYENIGGDRYLSGYIKGFEVVPLPYLLNVEGLPEEVGQTYTGETLFRYENNQYIANYKESMSIIEELFPKDKVIFLMCGGGGYAGMTKNFLISLGWNADKIYNIGGYWYYRGKNNVEVKKTIDGKDTYDFDIVPYHEIDFTKLTKSDTYKAPTVKVKEINLNTSKIELVEGASFKLNAIVLPNEATNKNVKWSSSDNAIATVSNEGLVTAIKKGNAEIIAVTEDGNIEKNCTVVVKEIEKQYVKLDDIKEVAERFNSLDTDILISEFQKKTEQKYDEEGNFISNKYYTCDDEGCRANDLWLEESEKLDEKIQLYRAEKLNIINQMVDEGKSFIILSPAGDCEARVFSLYLSAKEILDENNITYLSANASAAYSDFDSSKLNIKGVYSPVIAIIKEGKVFAYTDDNKVSLNNKEDLKRWLSQYLEIN